MSPPRGSTATSSISGMPDLEPTGLTMNRPSLAPRPHSSGIDGGSPQLGPAQRGVFASVL